jgi:pyruvate/2-oxoglutarate dehydrogenase complex dihydrolipoamide dehydrogenase (E3) component
MRALGSAWLYAIGDVNGRVLLTHMGKYQARIAADHILGMDVQASEQAHGALSPRVVFSDPQVAAVGHTLDSAERAGLRVRAVDQPTSGNAGGSFHGRNAPGTARLVIDEGRRVLVGATFTGADVAEFVHAATVAIVGEVTLDKLRHAVPSYPTRSEVWLRLLQAYDSEVGGDGRSETAPPRELADPCSPPSHVEHAGHVQHELIGEHTVPLKLARGRRWHEVAAGASRSF